MQLQEAILGRRSVRKFTDHVVTDEELTQILQAARWAPSWANTQTWEFVVVRDRQLMDQIVETYSGTNPARKCSLSASAMIVGCAQKGIAGCRDGKDRTKFNNWFMFDLGCAVENLSLRAHDMGLGTVMVGSMDHDACGDLLNLPADREVVVVLPIGKPMDPNKQGPTRKELKEFVHLNQFGKEF